MVLTWGEDTPKIPESAFIAKTAAVIGHVTVGEDSSIWYNAVVRGDGGHIEIGDRTNIQDNCTLHTEPGDDMKIGDNVSIGHNAVVHCTSVGDGTLIGMNATLLTGAVIGKHCIIGAGALVTEGKVIEDYSVVMGVPGKVVKKADENAVQDVMDNAERYVKKTITARRMY